ncbi:MAG: hypothetical protein OHK93_000743 [Ramalina farinacea]|uniref:Cytochrome P450 n=1 Tax=Ramalina farinacea TaxID=258253 RepID=A0AA43QFI3_9LECA|nr:hypothetical protein [Ramalina farinacea]
MGDDVVSRGMRMFTMPYGPKWRTYRGIVHQLVSATMTATFIPTQEYETKQLLFDLATDNANQRDFYLHMRRYAFSIIMTSTYGNRVNSYDHDDIKHADQSSRIIGQITRAGAFIVDEIPVLAYLPAWLQPGRRRAQEVGVPLLEAKMRLWRRLQKQIEGGHAPMCYARDMMEKRDSWRKEGLTDEDAAWITGGIVEVGSHTSSTTLFNLVKYLAAYPRAQQVAHDELMRVVGPDRTPTYEDIKDLPYIRSCVKEVLRLCPTPIWGIKHYADADVTYKDYVIPKGTVLLANTSFIHHDPERYDEPYTYKPERYLNHPKYSSEYAAQSDPYKRDHFSFGGGRRVCPGTRLAENTLNIAIANILWAFEIRPPIEDGVEAKGMDLSDDAFESTHFRGLKPFACRFVPRDTGRVPLIQSEWEQALKDGYVLRNSEVDVNGVVIH